MYQLRNPLLCSYDVSRVQKQLVQAVTAPGEMKVLEENEHACLYAAVTESTIARLPAAETHQVGKVKGTKSSQPEPITWSDEDESVLCLWRNERWRDSLLAIQQAHQQDLTVMVNGEVELEVAELGADLNLVKKKGKKRAREDDNGECPLAGSTWQEC